MLFHTDIILHYIIYYEFIIERCCERAISVPCPLFCYIYIMKFFMPPLYILWDERAWEWAKEQYIEECAVVYYIYIFITYHLCHIHIHWKCHAFCSYISYILMPCLCAWAAFLKPPMSRVILLLYTYFHILLIICTTCYIFIFYYMFSLHTSPLSAFCSHAICPFSCLFSSCFLGEMMPMKRCHELYELCFFAFVFTYYDILQWRAMCCFMKDESTWGHYESLFFLPMSLREEMPCHAIFWYVFMPFHILFESWCWEQERALWNIWHDERAPAAVRMMPRVLLRAALCLCYVIFMLWAYDIIMPVTSVCFSPFDYMLLALLQNIEILLLYYIIIVYLSVCHRDAPT